MQQEAKYAIHEAAREGRVNEVESLLNANPRFATRQDEDSRLPIHWAVSYNHLPIVQLIVNAKGFDVDAQDGLGWTALMMAVNVKDSDEVIKLLLNRDANVNATNHNGQTALHFTASKANLDAARDLIAAGATTRTKDKRGQLPIHRAAAVGSVPLIKLLLDNKSPLNATDMDGMTALHQAVSEGHGDAALALLKAGAETDKKNIDGNLAIEMAPDAKIRQYILQNAELEGVDVTLPD